MVQTAVVRQIVVPLSPTLQGFLPTWRKSYGLGLQADSSTGEQCSQKTRTVLRPGFKKKSLGFRKMLLESTLPLHNHGAGAWRNYNSPATGILLLR
jgi:hypothetical protein